MTRIDPALPAVGAPPARDRDATLRATAEQLEGVFVEQLFKAMRSTVPEGEGIVTGGTGEEMFTALLDQHLAADTPKHWERGLSDALYRQLRRGLEGDGAQPPRPLAAAPAPASSDTVRPPLP